MHRLHQIQLALLLYMTRQMIFEFRTVGFSIQPPTYMSATIELGLLELDLPMKMTLCTLAKLAIQSKRMVQLKSL